jgi:hypothetical protein
MNRRPLHFITREKEWELIQRLETLVDSSAFDPATTAVIMASPDYSATVAMHLAHAWSRKGEMLHIIPVDVTYPDEDPEPYIKKMQMQSADFGLYKHLVLVEAGIIRGGNWKWMVETLIHDFDFKREDITLVAMCENIHSKVKSDYVAEYYDDNIEELMFYFEKFNKHWPIR